MVEQIFLLPQVKRSVIISNKLVCVSCLTTCQTTLVLAKNLPKKRNLTLPVRKTFLLHMKTRLCLKYFMNDCLWKQVLASNSDLFRFDLFENFRNSKPFDSFNLKLERLICKRTLKFLLLDNCFRDLFSFPFSLFFRDLFQFGIEYFSNLV